MCQPIWIWELAERPRADLGYMILPTRLARLGYQSLFRRLPSTLVEVTGAGPAIVVESA